MNSFIYDIPVKVYFGENQLQYLGKELSKFGKRVLLTYGAGRSRRPGYTISSLLKWKKQVWKYSSYRV